MENGAFLFTAMDTRTTLSFMSLMPAPNSHGALVDNVSVRAPVPEPSSLMLLACGVGTAFKTRIAFRRSTALKPQDAASGRRKQFVETLRARTGCAPFVGPW